ncbi:hypothetical protein RN001_000620 [Aquatica leii]|uniref:RFX-type winged-helix domain-containing protein n=1 Tax=Aquatica leii TaxID=1421715 RepID=A0AAN7PF59_9COLE|nr:hypothetical protein RN001_000620 [Aquatica leii]
MVSKNQEDMAMDLDGKDNYLKNISPNLSETRSREESPKNGKKIQSRSERNSHIQQVIEAEISDISRKTIDNILEQVKTLTPTEHLLLYLKLPTECSNVGDPLRQPLNPLGSRSEISQTIMWIKTHLEEDPELSLPKQDVYNEYYAFCGPNKIKPLSTADFGKVMKQVYPRVRPRRLGTRGNSRYCYAGLRRRYKLDSPLLPDLNDKPQSSEFISTSDDLVSAAWTIIKEWSEQQLGIQFSSLQSLAYYLVLNLSVGNGSTAATIITSANKGSFKGDSLSSKVCNNKHREAQLQLQRKIHQKNEINREQKRKIQLQSPKVEQKGRSKKCKLQNQTGNASSNTSPLASTEGENNTSTCEDIQPVCDKSIDFTNLQSLPDFSSFQKMVAANDQACEYTNESYKPDSGENVDEVPGVNAVGKVPIPRLNNNIKFSPTSSPKRPKNVKYKAIQPKPEPCDIGLYNLQLNTGDFRSQEANYPGATNISEKKQKSVKKLPRDPVKTEIDDSFTSLTDASDSIFGRERLISVGDIDKSALDDYLGANNSQEHEEELVKYFENKDRNSDQDVSSKLTQLRQLLITQQNLETNSSQQTNVPLLSSNTSAFTKTNYKNAAGNLNMAQCYSKPYEGSSYSQAATEGARRRVSFETYHPEEAVPPSPNTRRKNFNFTPISPGPLSPNGRQSKCSSTTVSPFVSPRNTPVPKAKGNIHQNVNTSYIINQPNPPTSALNFSSSQRSLISVKTNLKIKQENEVCNDSDRLINTGNDSDLHNFAVGPSVYNYLPMSAPPSPKLALKSRNSNLLQKLLNSNNKLPYGPINTRSQSVTGNVPDNLSAEISQLLSSNVPQLNVEASYRSQSVPLHQMSTKTNQNLLSPAPQNLYTSQFPFITSTSQTAVQNEFNDYDSFSANENINMNKILNTIDSCPPSANLSSSERIKTPSQQLGTFGNLTDVSTPVNNELNIGLRPDTFDNEPSYKNHINLTQQCSNILPSLRVLGRSQSIDLDVNSDINGSLKCNPSRSVPTTPVPGAMPKLNFPRNRRSYPSTPLATNETFSFNHGQDYLLNGQPIKEKISAGTDIDPNLSFYQSTESNDEIYENVDIFNVNDTNLNCDILIEDNKNHFSFEGQLCDGNYNVKHNIGPVLDENCLNTSGNQYDFKNGTNDENS